MYQFQGELCSQSVLNSAVGKLRTELPSKWIFQVSIKGMLNPDLTYFIDWLSNIAFVHVELSLQFSEKRFPVNDKVTTKSFNVQALAKSTDPVKQNELWKQNS